MSILNRYGPSHFSQVNRQLLGGKLDRLAKVFRGYCTAAGTSLISTGTAAALPIPDNCIDYIFTDPPFGENLPYSELNFLVEAWHGVLTLAKQDAIVDRAKEDRSTQKSVDDYRWLMEACFTEYYRVLKPGRWLTVVFSNTRPPFGTAFKRPCRKLVLLWPTSRR